MECTSNLTFKRKSKQLLYINITNSFFQVIHIFVRIMLQKPHCMNRVLVLVTQPQLNPCKDTHSLSSGKHVRVYPLEPHFYIAKLGYAGVYLVFLFLLQNIDCGYSLEPPGRGGSNVYPQSMF